MAHQDMKAVQQQRQIQQRSQPREGLNGSEWIKDVRDPQHVLKPVEAGLLPPAVLRSAGCAAGEHALTTGLLVHQAVHAKCILRYM